MRRLSVPHWIAGSVVVFGMALAISASEPVFISEFLASNNGGLRDEDNDTPDWIEIFNSGTNTVSLGGWYLTDSAADLTKWRFPATNIGPNGFVLVFASGKNRATAGAPLHASFSLDADGEYLALVERSGAGGARS